MSTLLRTDTNVTAPDRFMKKLGSYSVSINNVEVVDPATDYHSGEPTAVHIDQGAVIGIGAPPAGFIAEKSIDATGLIACPGLVDVYARLRDPGYEKKADIHSETRAALAGGITTLVCSPDTDPVIDEVATVELINRRTQDADFAQVLPLAAITQQLDGERLSELATLIEAGCIGATNADVAMASTLVIRRAMEYAKTFDIVLVFAPVDPWLKAAGCAHEGAVSTRLGLPGIPVAAETVALSMLIELTRQTGARVHFSRITSERGVELIAQAKAQGLSVSADTSIAHLFFTENEIAEFDCNFHSEAPFRSTADRGALRAAIADGTLDAICSNHAPHDIDAKLAPFPSAEPGLSSVDTMLSLLLRLGEESNLSLPQILKPATSGAAKVFALDQGHLGVGSRADIILVDPAAKRTLNNQNLLSRGKNSPWLNTPLTGVVRNALVRGQLYEVTRAC